MLNDGDDDPVRIVSTAVLGNSTRAVAATLQPTTELYECMHSLIHAGASIQIVGSTLYGDGKVTANGDAVLFGGASLHADLSAAGSISGIGSVTGATKVLDESLPMPDPTDVIGLYSAEGTAINLNSLTLPSPPVITKNGDFNAGETHWFARVSGQLSSSNHGHTDASSVKTASRTSSQSGPAQDVTGRLVKGGQLNAECWVTHNAPDSGAGAGVGVEGATFLAEDSYAIFIEAVTTSGTSSQIQLTPWQSTNGSWVHLSGNLKCDWQGTLQKATCYVRSKNLNLTIWVDDFLVSEDTSGFELIHRVVFSPNNNPFGSTTNPKGIYVINCGNKSVALDRVRLHGTLVLTNVAHCTVRGAPCHFQSAVDGYPIIVADGGLTIESTDDGLAESLAEANFNPANAPFAGMSDSDSDDTYRSILDGIVYSSGSIQIGHESPLTGPVLANQSVTINNATLGQFRTRRYDQESNLPGFTKRAFVLGQNSIHETLPILPSSTSSQGGGDVPTGPVDPSDPTSIDPAIPPDPIGTDPVPSGPATDPPNNGQSFEKANPLDPVNFGI